MSIQEKEYIARSLINKNDDIDINNIHSLGLPNSTLKLNVDPETQKRLRAMKYVNNPRNMSMQNDKLEQLKNKQEKEDEFFKTLNYANRIKELKKKELISKTLQESNKNSLSISLICGQPSFLNFIIHNNSEDEELIHINVSKASTKDKKENKPDEGDNTLTLISNPEDWRLITDSEKMVKPNDYNIITPQGYMILKPNESVPLLFKLLSYDDRSHNNSYTIWAYKKNGQPLYFLNVVIFKVFTIQDHIFRYYQPSNRYSTIKIPNPYKFDKYKTQVILDNYQSNDSSIVMQLDPVSKDFFFKTRVQNEGKRHEFLLFLYLDNKKLNLLLTWRFELISMER